MDFSPAQEFLSTGQVAQLCSVTPDTVLKWIRAGKIPANRTPGGHHRIPHDVIKNLLERGKPASIDSPTKSLFQYCWQYNSRDGEIPDDCRQCIVFRSRTRRCYEMSHLPNEVGHARLFCKETCENCDYYKSVFGQDVNMLVITDQSNLKTSLPDETRPLGFNLKIADCEYRCSMIIEKFRPDYIVLDCSIGVERSREFANLLHQDPRIPFARIIMAGKQNKLPKECDKLVFALLERPITAELLFNLIHGANEYRLKQ